jgi:hypothetical protein
VWFWAADQGPRRFPDSARARLTVCARVRQFQSSAGACRRRQSAADTSASGRCLVGDESNPTRPRQKQTSIWVATHDLPRSAAHPLHTRLNQMLDRHDFDGYKERHLMGVGRLLPRHESLPDRGRPDLCSSRCGPRELHQRHLQVLSGVMTNSRVPHRPMMTECEILLGGKWRRITVEEALQTDERYGHCPECKTRVRPHRKGSNGMAAHFGHLQRNPDCSLSDKI